jgi:predicted HD phosphohydrolase
MRPEEVAAFEGEPHFAAAAALRQYDDRAKVVALETPPYAHFHRYLVGELSDL